MDRHEINI